MNVLSESVIDAKQKQLLNPIAAAAYSSYEMSSRASCFEGTRVTLIEGISGWLNDCNGRQSIYVLHGVAGIGKSTVSKSIAESAAARGVLGASFFFSRSEENRNTARSLFPTLAHQLSLHNREFSRQLSTALQVDSGATERDLQAQFSSLLAQPLRVLEEGGPILLLVDALDECEEKDAMTVLGILGREIPQLSQLKIFITTRPERHIRNELAKYENHEQFCLQDIEQSVVEADIRLYLGSRLSQEEVRQALPEFPPPPWQPTSQQMDTLVRMSGKLFIIAATAATFILDSKQLAPKKQLEILLSGLSPRDSSGSRHTFLDNMYLQILRAACPKQVGSWIGRSQIIVGTITLLQDPLPCNALAELLGIDASDIVTMLSNLHSLFAPGAEDQIFRMHHKSFPDFITDPNRRERSCEFYIDRAAHHLRIAKRCLIVMNSNLGRHEWNNNPAQHHQQNVIPPHLEYACTYWASHLALVTESISTSPPDDEVKQLLEYFASQHTWAWIDMLGCIRGINLIHFNIDGLMVCGVLCWRSIQRYSPELRFRTTFSNA